MPVPLFDPRTPLAPLRDELHAAVARVLDDGRFVLGPEVEAFEAELAQALGVPHAVGVANGTEAITIALRALGVGPGDEVVVPSFTFYASAEAIPPTGATPVFADIDLETMCVTPETVRAAMTPRTKAIVAVDLFGTLAPDLRDLGVPVVEDAAQAAGTPGAGTRGTLATLSFYPSKNLGAFGDGGAVVTADAALVDRVRTLRFHGSEDKVTYTEVGYNSRLDELQAAILRVQLPHLPAWAAHRAQVRRWYDEEDLGGVVLQRPTTDPVAWHIVVGRHPDADAVLERLNAAGVGARAYYRVPVHRQPAMRPWGGAELPATEEAARTHLALPVSAVLAREQVAEVAAALKAAP